MKVVEQANLPEMAKKVIIGEKYSHLLKEPLEKLGLDPMFIPDNGFVDPRLSGHADLSVLHLGGNQLWLAPYLRGSDFSSRLSTMGLALHYPDILQSAVYPGDAQMNVCICGKFAICSVSVVPKEIVDLLTTSGLKIINCRQGYAKCSVCVVDAGSIITADRGIEAAARKAGLETLMIEPSYIALDGFPHGFIGGSAFKISRSKLAFTGVLDGHKNKNQILSFLDRHQVEPIYLTEMPIFDIGSAIPLMEK